LRHLRYPSGKPNHSRHEYKRLAVRLIPFRSLVPSRLRRRLATRRHLLPAHVTPLPIERNFGGISYKHALSLVANNKHSAKKGKDKMKTYTLRKWAASLSSKTCNNLALTFGQRFNRIVLGGFSKTSAALLSCVLAATILSPAHAQTVTAQLPVGTTPFVAAVNPVTNKVYVSNGYDNTVTVIDGAGVLQFGEIGINNKTTTVNVGTTPGAIAVNPVTNKIYVANTGSATVTVIDGLTNQTTTVRTGLSPNSLAVNVVTNQTYVTNNRYGTVTVIDAVNNYATYTITAGTNPQSVAVNPVTNKIYIVNLGAYPAYLSSVTVIDGPTRTVTATVSSGTSSAAAVVNPLTNTIYVNNSAGVAVIDGVYNTVKKSIPTGLSPSSLAVNPVTNKIYVANQLSNTVTVIDGATAAVDISVATGVGPFSVAVNSVTNQIYVANVTGTATVIDGSNHNATNLPTGARPVSVAVNPVTNRTYVLNQGYPVGSGIPPVSGTLSVIDGATNSPATLAAGKNPFGVAINPVTNKTYVSNYGDGTVTVMDFTSNTTSLVSVGLKPYASAVNSVTNRIYVANSGSNTVTVIDGVTNGVIATVATGALPYSVAVNPVTNKVYVANAQSNSMTVIDGVTNHPIPVLTGSVPVAVAVNPVTNKIYTANSGSNTVTVIDGATNTPTPVPTGSSPDSVAVNPLTNKIYIANGGDGTITIIDGANNNATSLITGGSNPRCVAVNPVTNTIYVANFYSNTVTVIDGATQRTTNIMAGTYPISVVVNPVTNKIYTANYYSSDETVIDGYTNTAKQIVSGATNPVQLAVNPVTNKIYVANFGSNNLTVINEQQVQSSPLTTAITPLTNGQTANPTPTFTFTSQSGSVSSPAGVYFQVDTWQNTWSAAVGSNPTFTGISAPLQPGFHILYAFSVDGQEGTISQSLSSAGSPQIGAVQAYGFLVAPLGSQSGPTAQTISFPAIPSQVAGTQLRLNASASSGLSVSFSSSTANVCTVLNGTASLLASGTCTITASQVGDATFAPAASVSQSFSVAPVPAAQTISFPAIPTQVAGTQLRLNASASSGLPVSFGSSTSNVCTVLGGTASLIAPGTCSITAFQSGNATFAPATSVSQTFSVQAIVPDVTLTAKALAQNLVVAAGLVPTFTGTGTWVSSQSPAAGTVVAPGVTVTMRLSSGSQP
jgi:YVTN family beta-propeller protein